MKKVSRLFEGFAPEHYSLRIDPDRDSRQVRGTVTLKGLKKGRPSQRITLHQHGLKITGATITRHDKRAGDQPIPITRINHQRSLDEVRLHTETLLYPGAYTITCDYSGAIDDTNHGIYLCNYTIDGAAKSLVATDLESHHCREVFPCIDEPEAKATFQLTLASPPGETALSNTPPESTAEHDGKLHTTFQVTPRMSTYLFCFVYGDMQYRETQTADGVDVRVWATKAHRPEALDFALQTAKRSIEFFNDYYGVPYPLPKSDHVALPDFSAAAMENWGIITYREPFLLADPATSSQAAREFTAIVVNHELSHQWFGDLVTMRWWDDLWLNESFANVMEYLGTDALYPEWGIWDSAVTNEGLAALRRDAIPSVQAVKQEVRHPDEIGSLFDPHIVYAKGGRLIRMLMHWIGEDDFRKGLKQYFEKHAYSNTTRDDLWQALQAASGKDIAGFMNPWLERSGFPVLHVEQHGTQLHIAQSHYQLDPALGTSDRLWPVPLLPSSPQIPALLQKEHCSVTLKNSDFIRINQGAIGHYLVHYANPEHAAAVAGLVDTLQLTEAERLMLLNDSSMLARNGTVSFAATLDLLQHYSAEASQSVWDMIAMVVGDMRRFVDLQPDIEQAVKAYVRGLIEPQYARLGWTEHPGESAQDTKLRATILGLGVYAEHPAICERALELFTAYQSDASVIPAELRTVVFSAAVRRHVPGAFDYLLNLEETTTSVELKHELLAALSATHNTADGATLLDRLKDSTKVRRHDVTVWMRYLIANRHLQDQAWAWLRDNWSWIEETFATALSFDYFPRFAALGLNTRQRLEEYKEFFTPLRRLTALTRNIDMGIEELEARIVWIERDISAVDAFFAFFTAPDR